MAYTQALNVPSPPIRTGTDNQTTSNSVAQQQYMASVNNNNYTIGDAGAGGGGGGSVSNAPRTFAPAPFTPKPVVKPPVTPAPPEAPAYTPPAPPPEPQSPAQILNPPPKNPQPVLPDIDALGGTKPVTTHPERYTVGGREWTVSALSEGVGDSPNITPVTLPFGVRPAMKPLLKTDGVVVEVDGNYLVSPQTLADIQNSGNPHYDIAENGRIVNTPMGKTVPVIKVDVSNLPATGSKRDVVNGFAGVRDVDYIYETPTIAGIPEGLLDQINYTLDADTQRPADKFTVWKLGLTADYTIEKLVTSTAQEDGKLDMAKLKTFLSGLDSRLQLLRKDFNIIKTVFYRGELAEADRNGFAELIKVATSDDTDDEIQKPETANYVIKTSTTTGVQPTPISSTPQTAASTAASVATITTTPTGTSVSPAASQSDGSITRWVAYGFTPAEKAEIKKTSEVDQPPFVTVTDGSTIGTGAVRFGPSICAKARIVLPELRAKSNGPSPFEQYYGTGMNSSEYIRLNRIRIAELLQLARQIRELEQSNGKIY